MGIFEIIIAILWTFMGLFCFVQNQEQIEKLTAGNALAAYFIFIAFGPYFIIINILENILSWLGWEDNDDGYGV